MRMFPIMSNISSRGIFMTAVTSGIGFVFRSVESSNHDAQSDDGETTTYSGASTPRRRRSLSPTVRRSPVSRVKERDTSRRQRSPAQFRARYVKSAKSLQRRDCFAESGRFITLFRSPSDNRSNAPSSAASNGAAGGPVLVHSEVIFDAVSFAILLRS